MEYENSNKINDEYNGIIINDIYNKIIFSIKQFIDNNKESKDKLEKTLNYILNSINYIIKGYLIQFSKNKYINLINDLEKNIKELNEKEKRLLEKISYLEFELITNKKINEKNKPIKQEEYESIIKKLKKKFQDEKELYKLNEIKYIDRIEELTKLNKELNKEIENLQNERLNNSNSFIKNSSTFYKSKTPKKNYSINFFEKKKFNFSSVKDINDIDYSLNSNLSSPKYIDIKKKYSIENKLRLYKLYQKNKHSNLQSKFFINQNNDKFNFIIKNNGKNIKHLLPRNPFERKEKHYYSAFLKY